MRFALLLLSIALASLETATATANDVDDANEDYQEPPYVRPPPFKGCDLGELDKFLPMSIRNCAASAAQGAMPITLLQQILTTTCKVFKNCHVFYKKGTPMPETEDHHCLHGVMTQVRKTDVTGQSILLMKNIIAAKGYSRERILNAMDAVVDCIDNAGMYLPLHRHQFLKVLDVHFRLLE